MTKPRRTKKEFVDYNDYKDRVFGLKWGTAFALSELTQVIAKAKNEALKSVEALPVMSRDAMDEVLQHAFLKSRNISIQCSTRDDNGNLMDSIVGPFVGLADAEFLYVNDDAIAWDTIRNIRLC